MAKVSKIFHPFHPTFVYLQEDLFGGFFCEDILGEFTSPTFSSVEDLESFLDKRTKGVTLLKDSNEHTKVPVQEGA